MKVINVIAILLVIIGGINWGLVGIFQFNLIDYLFKFAYLDRIIYTLVGISAVYLALAWKMVCRTSCKR